LSQHPTDKNAAQPTSSLDPYTPATGASVRKARLMRISPSSYHLVPRTRARSSCPGTAEEHEIGLECPIRCLTAVVPAPALDELTRAVSPRSASQRVLTVADVLALYRDGDLARLPGIGPRRMTRIEDGLLIAGLITRRARPRRRLRPGKAAPR